MSILAAIAWIFYQDIRGLQVQVSAMEVEAREIRVESVLTDRRVLDKVESIDKKLDMLIQVALENQRDDG